MFQPQPTPFGSSFYTPTESTATYDDGVPLDIVLSAEYAYAPSPVGALEQNGGGPPHAMPGSGSGSGSQSGPSRGPGHGLRQQQQQHRIGSEEGFDGPNSRPAARPTPGRDRVHRGGSGEFGVGGGFGLEGQVRSPVSARTGRDNRRGSASHSADMAGSRYDQHQQHTSLLPVLFSSSASHGAGAPAHSPASAPTTAPAATALALAPTLAPASVSVSASAAAAAAAATSGQSQEPHGPLHLPHRPQQQQVHPLQRLPQRLHQQHPGHSLGLSHQHPHPHSHAHQTHQQLQLHLLQQQHNHNQQHPSLAPYTSSYQRNRTQTQAQVQTHSQTDLQHKLAANPGYNIPSPAASAASSCSNSNNPPSTLSSYNPNSNAHAVATPASSTTSASAPNSASVRALSADMAGDSSADAAFHDDLAAQQRAAESYQPDLQGPLIGDRLTSNAITAEYAKADPVYVEKTINLPQTYSHYRPVQGDGNCGWRAIGFSYFEHLVFAGDPDKLSQELARLTSLNNYIANVGGYDFELFEDMVHETLSLIKDLADVVTDSATAMALLMTRFNDAQCSNAIVYHLRLLAGSWLKGNSNDFEPFLVGSGGLLQWCNENIEVPDREIDHIGITLLANILLKPIGFVLEITYLDRTPGSQANVYRLPEEATGQDPANLGPIIYLLYRPAHYDILYHKMSSRFPNPAAGAPAPLELQVNRAMSFSQQHEVASATPSLHNFSTVDFSALAMLPGFSGPPSAMSSLASPTAVSPMHNAYDPSPQTPWLSAPFSDSAMQQTAPPAPSAALGLLRTQPRQPPPSSTTGSQAAPPKPSQPVDYQLRFSSQCFHLKNPPAEPTSMLSHNGYMEPNFTTTMFKNSHFNKAHYNNPQFHPEEWVPDDEPHDRSVNSKRKIRSRSD
ncbi:hypothetical protein D7B24_000645 [Verticillium nonalfalfae]|uniref:ubiquitinyl hydrolase 1 n=1 Tax=Verticillium nonalfalfae TaxID=1051616 RepID=A0A3M9YK49_9PEZI|nr:uncharacterized protein D7B24_000645 [Verticillium nonalfalfae]RNJ59928.1 hypothetical protein D7B24_000645 [Verticillium nonalfalfae]